MSSFPVHSKVSAALKRLMPHLQTRHSGASAGSRIGVGVSGGPDSIALLSALLALRAKHDLQLTVLHVNHGLRPEADHEQRCVEQWCQGWNVSCRTKKLRPQNSGHSDHAGHIDHAEHGSDHGPDHGIEAWARTERYQFFQQAMRQGRLDYIALAHTADDQAETVLFRLLRGSGRRGIAGMPAKRTIGGQGHGQLIRPLLTCTRQEVLAYVAERQLPFVTDPSNADVRFARNHIRHRLLPLLEQEFSPQIRRHLSQLAETLRAEEEWLESSASALRLQLQAGRAVQDEQDEQEGQDPLGKRLSVQGVRNVPAALRARILRQWIEQAGLSPEQNEQNTQNTKDELGFIHLDQVQALCEGRIRGIVELPGDRQVRIASDRLVPELVLEPKNHQNQLSTKPYLYTIARGQALTLPELGWSLSLSLPRSWTSRPLQARLATPWSALFDATAIPDALTVRSFCPGDRIFPLGMGGKKKIHDVFIDAKVPHHLRCMFPLIVLNPGDTEIAWVPGHARGQSALVTDTTHQVCQLDCQLDRQYDASPLPEKPELW